MTTIKVEMRAFMHGEIRLVTIPDGDAATLGNVFKYGQNDFCVPDDLAQNMPSVSVGDIVQMPNGPPGDDSFERYVVTPIGFRKVSADFKPPPQDGGLYAYYFYGSFEEQETDKKGNG